MDKLAVGVLAILGGIFVLFFAITLGTLMGAICGWIVGLFFSPEILGVLGKLGLHDVSMWQFGAFMGFIGGFLRSRLASVGK